MPEPAILRGTHDERVVRLLAASGGRLATPDDLLAAIRLAGAGKGWTWIDAWQAEEGAAWYNDADTVHFELPEAKIPIADALEIVRLSWACHPSRFEHQAWAGRSFVRMGWDPDRPSSRAWRRAISAAGPEPETPAAPPPAPRRRRAAAPGQGVLRGTNDRRVLMLIERIGGRLASREAFVAAAREAGDDAPPGWDNDRDTAIIEISTADLPTATMLDVAQVVWRCQPSAFEPRSPGGRPFVRLWWDPGRVASGVCL